jgi:N6-L-threonylcarbamoyladenine synthase
MSAHTLVLGIETSCDETSVAVVEDGRLVRSCVIGSSQDDFRSSGGVIPEYAARRQVEAMVPCIDQALRDAKVTPADLSLIAVAAGPGLLGSLLVGTTSARAFAAVHKLPVLGLHHTLGHLSSTWLCDDANDDEPVFPMLTLSVSGGHSDLWYRTSHTSGRLLGSTLDDAAGEAFDKGAQLLGLGYPGGPLLSKLAAGGNADAYGFPEPLAGNDGIDFSFSGMKTSLKYLLRDLPPGVKDDPKTASDIAASYEHAIVRHLVRQTQRALEAHPETRELHVVGGVSANTRLRRELTAVAAASGVKIRVPSSNRYCTDNGAMIAAAGCFLHKEQPEACGTFRTSADCEALVRKRCKCGQYRAQDERN